MKLIQLTLGIVLIQQTEPIRDIPKEALPAVAHCVVCVANGNDHGEEKPVAGVVYNGKNYYFCNKSEIKSFKEDPEGFLPPVLPRPMPAFEFQDISGKVWNSAATSKNVYLLDWWASWCKPCIEMMPSLDKIRTKFADKGFEMLSISIDEKKSDFDKFIAKHKFANPVMLDDKETWSKFGIRTIPALFLIKDNTIIAQWRGKQKSGVIEVEIERALR